MIEAGADVMRVNGAHTPPDQIARWVTRVRQASEKAGRRASVLVDLPGTKIRVGTFAGRASIDLEPHQVVRLFPGKARGTPDRIPIRSLNDLSVVPLDVPVLLADGAIRLLVTGREGKALRARVIEGGELLAGKGVDFPGARLPTVVPTRQDGTLARAAVAARADGLALSFVRHADDVLRLRRLLKRERTEDMPIVVKIEREDAVENLHLILRHADAALVARGDLGVDVGPERVPPMQKQIIEAARRMGRPVIVATEMLESMVTRTRPTRAEASDVAGAVFEAADAVMLSAETAVGRHPVLAVETMARILSAAEADPGAPYAGHHHLAPASLPGRADQHVVHAAVTLARNTNAEAIVVFTRTGTSAVRLSKERPNSTIHAYATSEQICRRLTLAWGVRPKRLPSVEGGTDAIVARVRRELRRQDHLPRGSRAVLVMGAARDPAGATTMIQLLQL
jgi:pyruvate kinase